MNPAIRHRLKTTLLVAVFVAALAITLMEFVQLRRVDHNTPLTTLDQLQSAQPWGGYAARQAAAQLTQQWRLDPAGAQAGLAWALSRYPLDPWRWLTLARIDQALDRPSPQVQQRLDTAREIQPGHRELNWEILNLTQRLNDQTAVLAAIQHWLAVEPTAVNDGLYIASRWVDDLATTIDQILPADEAYWVQAMRYARMNRLPDLADVVWARLEQPRVLGDEALKDYLIHLSGTGEVARLQSLWAQYDPAFEAGGIPGGYFHVPQEALSTFGWDLRTPSGLSIQRTPRELPPDFRSALWRQAQGWDRFLPGALTLTFDGQHNVNASTPRLRMPAPRPGRYRLSGWWKASGLTTRSLPVLEIVTLLDRRREVVALPNRNFPWSTFETEFEITAPDETLIIQMVRRRTRAFDRNIEGQVALTGLRLERIDTPQPDTPPPDATLPLGNE